MSNFYPDETLEEVRMNNDIVGVVSEYVKLKRSGRNYFGICPFHHEKSPSMSVSPDKQIFHCFGCGTGGNVIHFIMKIENLDFQEAVRHLADRAHIRLPEENDSPEELARSKQREEILKLNREAARFFYTNLKSDGGRKAREYLARRSISDETIRCFGLGYSSEEWQSLYEHIRSRGFSDEIIRKSGLVSVGKNGGCYDKFRGRVMFPIFDLRGHVIGFGGRVLDDSKPKYMNSPETIVYNKSKSLYGLNFAKDARKNTLVVVEGYMDAISLHQQGITNVVASLGTALTEPQARLLKKYAEEIIIAYDADAAGQAATIRGMEVLQNAGCTVRVLTVPEGKDPDDFVRKNGKDAFERLMRASISLVEYKVRNLKKQMNIEDTQGKIDFLNKMADILAKVENAIERDVYLKKIAAETGISGETIYAEIMKRNRSAVFRSGQNRITVSKNKNDGSIGKIDGNVITKVEKNHEKLLLFLMCSYPRLGDRIRKDIMIEDFSSPVHQELFKIISDETKHHQVGALGEMMNVLKDEALIGAFSEIAQMQFDAEDLDKAVTDLLNRFKSDRIDNRISEVTKQLQNPAGLSEGDVEKLRSELKRLLLSKKK